MIFSRVEEPKADDDPIGSELDKHIHALQDQVTSLKTQLSLQASTILSSHSTLSNLSLLCEQREASAYTGDINPLLSTAKTQHAHNLTNLYRICASITSFTIQDPDPNAVNRGHILALRFDVSENGKFIRPYYVMLNKPWNGEKNMMLKVHRHTLPPAIPLATLVEKHLSSSKGTLAMASEARRGVLRQSLLQFSRALRSSIVSYHNRLSTMSCLRQDFGLDDTKGSERKFNEDILLDLSATDAEIKNLRLEWMDGRIGSLVVDEDGAIKKCIIIGERGRYRVTERALLGDMKKLGEKLRSEYTRILEESEFTSTEEELE